MRRSGAWRVTVALILAVSLVFCGKPAGAAELDEKAAEAWFDLSCRRVDENGIEITLNLSSKEGICGLIATLLYDEELVLLTSCGAVGNELEFAYAQKEGAVTFLLDGYENSAPEGALVRFYFAWRAEEGEACFGLALDEESCVYTLSSDGRLMGIRADVSDCRVILGRDGSPIAPSVSEIEVICNGEGTVVLCARLSENAPCAVGFKLFALNVPCGGAERIFVARFTSAREVSFELSSLSQKRLCLVVTPVLYDGRRIFEGEKSVFFLE